VIGTAAGTVNVAIEGSLFARNGIGLSFQDGAAGYVHASTISGGTTGVVVAPPTPIRTARIEVRDCTTLEGGEVVSGGDNRLFNNATDGAFSSIASKH